MENENLKYKRLISFLNEELDAFPDEQEIELIASICRKAEAWSANVGLRVERIKHNDREKAFHDEWMKMNEPVSNLNSGNGILQDLFINENPLDILSKREVVEIISARDRVIVATVIQWLGSNCGMCFLNEALARFGGYVAYKKQNH